jgi:hypothetical protein
MSHDNGKLLYHITPLLSPAPAKEQANRSPWGSFYQLFRCNISPKSATFSLSDQTAHVFLGF